MSPVIKSKAQLLKLQELLRTKGITQKQYNEWLSNSGDLSKLPDRLPPNDQAKSITPGAMARRYGKK